MLVACVVACVHLSLRVARQLALTGRTLERKTGKSERMECQSSGLMIMSSHSYYCVVFVGFS
jgi:hypothetical protein